VRSSWSLTSPAVMSGRPSVRVSQPHDQSTQGTPCGYSEYSEHPMWLL
jgi:hypothetical protein